MTAVGRRECILCLSSAPEQSRYIGSSRRLVCRRTQIEDQRKVSTAGSVSPWTTTANGRRGYILVNDQSRDIEDLGDPLLGQCQYQRGLCMRQVRSRRAYLGLFGQRDCVGHCVK